MYLPVSLTQSLELLLGGANASWAAALASSAAIQPANFIAIFIARRLEVFRSKGSRVRGVVCKNT